DLLIEQVQTQKRMVLKCTRALRELSLSPKYKDRFDLLMSIPGIGPIVAMCILTEVYDITRFSNERQFASYLGLIPTCHSSGEKVSHGEKTFRGNKKLGPMIVETCWVAVNKDTRFSSLYGGYCQRMKRQEAIIRVARKMSNIIFGVLKNNTAYVPLDV
ncbi:MAG: transposase, partial [Bacteroidales bacterium]|nr:transposase [Bacteroidales bacterium]